MLSVSGSYIAAYSYRSVDDSTPTLYVWNWEQQALIATYSVPWINTDHGGGYAGHPALHITPSSILLIGGRLGVHSIYAETDSESNKTFSRVQHVQSSPEDAKSLRFSSQGRCSRLWWGASRPWHRLLVSPSTWEHAGPRPLRLLSFEVSTYPGDTQARKQYTELGNHPLASGFENSPQLFHVSRYGTKAVWFSPMEDRIRINSVSIPSFEQQIEGVVPSSVKRIILEPPIKEENLRAFDTDETGPMFAFASEDKLWVVEVV